MILEYTAMGACLMEAFLMSNLVSLCLPNSRQVRCPILARSFGLIWSRLRTMSLCGCLARRKAVSLCWLHASLMVCKRLLAFPPMRAPRSGDNEDQRRSNDNLLFINDGPNKVSNSLSRVFCSQALYESAHEDPSCNQSVRLYTIHPCRLRGAGASISINNGPNRRQFIIYQ